VVAVVVVSVLMYILLLMFLLLEPVETVLDEVLCNAQEAINDENIIFKNTRWR
jgi:hypothetical protein